MHYVLISYRWDPGRPEEKWLFWLKKTLEQKGFHVTLSELRGVPDHHNWVSDIQMIYEVADENLYRVPHDPGCLTILSYLEGLKKRSLKDTVLLVAGIGDTHASFPARYNRMLGSGKQVGFMQRNLSWFHQKQQDTIDRNVRLVVLYSSLGPLLEQKGDKQTLLT